MGWKERHTSFSPKKTKEQPRQEIFLTGLPVFLIWFALDQRGITPTRSLKAAWRKYRSKRG